MRLILVRHGQTPWNKKGRFQGQSLVGLNQRGIMQAQRVAKALLPMKLTALYSSPLPRTLMTAQEISRELCIPVVPLEGIKEVNLGEMEGKTGQEMRTEYAQVYATWRRDPSEVVFPGGESMLALQERVRDLELVEYPHVEVADYVRQDRGRPEESNLALGLKIEQRFHGLVFLKGLPGWTSVELNEVEVVRLHSGETLVDSGDDVLTGVYVPLV